MIAKFGIHIAAGVALAFAALAGVQTLRLSWEQTAHAETVTAHEKQVAAAALAAKEAVDAARAEEQRRYTELQEIANETSKALARARADGAAAVAVAGRLRERIVALVAAAGRCPGDSDAAGGGEAARAAGDLLDNLQRRLDEAADAIARHADDARIAGLACERSYNALTY